MLPLVHSAAFSVRPLVSVPSSRRSVKQSRRFLGELLEVGQLASPGESTFQERDRQAKHRTPRNSCLGSRETMDVEGSKQNEGRVGPDKAAR